MSNIMKIIVGNTYKMDTRFIIENMYKMDIRIINKIKPDEHVFDYYENKDENNYERLMALKHASCGSLTVSDIEKIYNFKI